MRHGDRAGTKYLWGACCLHASTRAQAARGDAFFAPAPTPALAPQPHFGGAPGPLAASVCTGSAYFCPVPNGTVCPVLQAAPPVLGASLPGDVTEVAQQSALYNAVRAATHVDDEDKAHAIAVLDVYLASLPFNQSCAWTATETLLTQALVGSGRNTVGLCQAWTGCARPSPTTPWHPRSCTRAVPTSPQR